MNKKQLIDSLRQDAEWWLLPIGAVESVFPWGALEQTRIDAGWKYVDDDYETESWFNLLIASALEKGLL